MCVVLGNPRRSRGRGSSPIDARYTSFPDTAFAVPLPSDQGQIIVARLKETHPDAKVIYRDLDKTPLPHVTPADLADPTFVDEFLRADIIVIGAPMYNLNIPSTLKAWIDRVVIAQKTFRYGPNGVEGLAGGRRVIVASSRGNFYAPPSPLAAVDHQETYLKTMFGFLGITDITFVRAEGTGRSPELRKKAINNALDEISVLA